MFKVHDRMLSNSGIFTKSFYLFLFLCLFLPSISSALEHTERKKVLVLFSFRSTMPVAAQWDKGIRSVLSADNTFDFILNVEHLDLSHFRDEHHTKLLLDLYRYKYAEPKPDLIIPILNASVGLTFDHRADFFPGVPIVFGGVEKSFIDQWGISPNTTGYLTDIDYRETLDLALKLHPKTRNIVVIGGAGQIVEKWISSLALEYKEYEERFGVSYLTGLPMQLLLEKVKKIPADTVIISLPILLDGAGKEFVGNESLAMVAKETTAPIYTFWDVTLGTGVVGGHMGSFEREGKEVALLGVRVLNGEKPSSIPITKAPKFNYMFDWRELRRLGISEKSLPPDSIVQFKEFSLWDQYKSIFSGLFALFVFLLLAISYLIFQKRTLLQAKDELASAEQKYRTVSDHTYDWEYWQTPDSKMQYVSPSCWRISGYTAHEFVENPYLLQQIILPEDKWIWDKHIGDDQNSREPEVITFRILRPDGEIRWIEHVCQPVFDARGKDQGVRASNRDITEREFYKSQAHQLQSELAHMDRLITVSALTSALAHEINQPLAAMRSYAQAGIRFLGADVPDLRNAEKALHGVVEDNKRAAAVINRLRLLVKKGAVERKLLEINTVINDVLAIMNSEIILQNVSINVAMHPKVSVVFIDLVQFQQVLINILTNAFDAMADQLVDKRNLSISVTPDTEDCAVISISDSGNGIPVELMETIFDPFQTTKTKGIGIGLSICKSIIKAHDGKIFGSDNESGGATFSIVLPTTSEPGKNTN